MVNYREILRLHSLKYSQRKIAACVHSSRSTIQQVLSFAAALKISWPLTPETTSAVLESLLYPGRSAKDTDRMLPDFPKIHRELAQKGVALSLLRTEYSAQAQAAGKKFYMTTQFGDLYRAWARVSRATMRIQRKPGEAFEVDWAGKTVPIYDNVTGETVSSYLFVGVLSCSGYIYAELCRDMRSESFIACHVPAYEYFGGVTRLLIPHNLRVGVTRNTRYETVIPRACREMADHYDTAVVPARPKSPDDKPNAEGSVKFAATWILAALRNDHFFSFEEARAAVAGKLEELNTRPFQKWYKPKDGTVTFPIFFGSTFVVTSDGEPDSKQNTPAQRFNDGRGVKVVAPSPEQYALMRPVIASAVKRMGNTLVIRRTRVTEQYTLINLNTGYPIYMWMDGVGGDLGFDFEKYPDFPVMAVERDKSPKGLFVPARPLLVPRADPAHTQASFDERTAQGLLTVDVTDGFAYAVADENGLPLNRKKKL